MKMRTLLATTALTALTLLAASTARAQDVRFNFDKNTDFSKFKTYKWTVIKDAQTVNNIVDKNIKDAVNAQLATKGLTQTDGDSPDLLVAYQPAVGQEKEFSSYSSTMGGGGWGYGPGWGAGGWYGGGMGSTMTSGQTSTIYMGQLAIDMYDPANKDLVWRGVASKQLDPKAKPEKQEKNMNKAMAKLFKNFPPTPKK